jgi:hypothetical protein
MQLALKSSNASDAKWWHRMASWVIKTRLVSQYSHGGIVIDGDLYHTNAQHGLHKVPAGWWEPSKWDIFDLDTRNDDFAKALFEDRQGAKYDWLGLLAFIGADIYTRDRLYCFEWCWIAMTQPEEDVRVTPELLLVAAHQIQQRKVFINHAGALKNDNRAQRRTYR